MTSAGRPGGRRIGQRRLHRRRVRRAAHVPRRARRAGRGGATGDAREPRTDDDPAAETDSPARASSRRSANLIRRERIALIREQVLNAVAEPAINILSVVAPIISRLPHPVARRGGVGRPAASTCRRATSPVSRSAVHRRRADNQDAAVRSPARRADDDRPVHAGRHVLRRGPLRHGGDHGPRAVRSASEGFDEVLALEHEPPAPPAGRRSRTTPGRRSKAGAEVIDGTGRDAIEPGH